MNAWSHSGKQVLWPDRAAGSKASSLATWKDGCIGSFAREMQTTRKEMHVPQWRPLILTKLTVGVPVMHRVEGSCP